MKLSVNWLKELTKVDNIDVNILADKLTASGFEVEGIDFGAVSSDKLVIGLVVECQPHPDSDHLNVCQVDIGKAIIQVICGAPNVAAGQKVIVALAGAKLPQVEISKSVIRGVESNGMVCSLSEVGVDKSKQTAEQLAGIEVLDESAVVGGNPLEFLGLDDAILDIAITPNRADCNGVFDMVKEVCAVMDYPQPELLIDTNINEKTDLVIKSETDN